MKKINENCIKLHNNSRLVSKKIQNVLFFSYSWYDMYRNGESMKTYLLSCEFNGVKNINQPIHFQFYNKVLKNEFDSQGYNVKAIYGKNGSGKSGIIHAVEVYRNIILEKNYLNSEKGMQYLQQLINYETKKMYMGFEYVIVSKSSLKPITICKHEITLSKSETEVIYISEEKFKKITVSTRNEKTVLHVVDGEVISSELSKDILAFLYNRMKERSVLDIMISEIVNRANGSSYNFDVMIPFLAFISSLHVYLDESNLNSNFLNAEEIHNIEKKEIRKIDTLSHLHKIINEYLGVTNKKTTLHLRVDSKFILKQDEEKYLRMIDKLKNFIKVFKPKLKNIDVEFRPYTSKSSIANLYFSYEDGSSVFLDFESNGIKKLVKLFGIFSLIDNGEIGFIDELDANINDVYLTKLIEYFSDYSQGQLIFTTHSISPMEVLSKKSYSIDFLTDQSEVYSWKKTGNYSVVNLYRGGYFKDLHFNTEAFDFIGMFEDEK